MRKHRKKERKKLKTQVYKFPHPKPKPEAVLLTNVQYTADCKPAGMSALERRALLAA